MSIVIKAVLQKIDAKAPLKISPRTLDITKDAESFSSRIIEEADKPENYKTYKFRSESTEVCNLIKNSESSDWTETTNAIAERLHKKEVEAEGKIKNLNNELRKGSVLQISIQNDNELQYIICKVDSDSYLNESNLLKESGLPWQKRSQKAVIVNIVEGSVDSVKVFDTNYKVSSYWWDSFLELEELNSSEDNTVRAFNAIDNTLKLHVKKHSNIDYWNIRNSVLLYFRNNDGFKIEDIIETTIKNYKPDNPKIDTISIASKMRELPEKKRFDSQFNISSDTIKAKMKRTIQLQENLELNIKGGLDEFKKTIKAGEDDSGEKYIKIYSENGYNEFKTPVS